MERNISLGKFIYQRRKLLQLTQEQLAKKLQVSKSAVAKWETDGGIPSRDNLYKLAKELRVTVNDLHKYLDDGGGERVNIEINITQDILLLLEAYGFRVLYPYTNE